jgi:hypothetical protein
VGHNQAVRPEGESTAKPAESGAARSGLDNDSSSQGRVVLHRFNGDEIYSISSATLMCVEVDDSIDYWFEFETLPDAIQTVPDTAESRMHPSGSAVVTLKDADLDALVGRALSIPLGLTDERWDAHLYYFEHEDLDNNEIRVLARRGDEFHVRWTATTTDINYYDGSKPDTQVEIEGWFALWEGRPAPNLDEADGAASAVD